MPISVLVFVINLLVGAGLAPTSDLSIPEGCEVPEVVLQQSPIEILDWINANCF